jgi:hypothetical protein
MVRTKQRSRSPIRWLWCLLLVLVLAPASPVGADDPGGLVRFWAAPNPVIIPYGTETGSTTITWNTGGHDVPELWVPDPAIRREMRLPAVTTPSGSTPLTVRMGQSTTVNLYTAGHGTLLGSVVVTTQHPSGNAVSNLPAPTLAPVPVSFNKTTLQPANVYTTFRANHETDGLCSSLSVFGTGPDGGTDPGIPWDTITVGFVHQYEDDGVLFIPCSDTIDAFYRGAVQFDLSGQTYHHFLSATLTFRILDSTRHYDVPAWWPNEPGIWSAAAGADGATDNWLGWHSGDGHDYINGDGAHLSMPGEKMLLPTTTLDVTSMVRDWLEGNKPNNGFVFYGHDEGYPNNNETFICRYTDFTLTLHYF